MWFQVEGCHGFVRRCLVDFLSIFGSHLNLIKARFVLPCVGSSDKTGKRKVGPKTSLVKWNTNIWLFQSNASLIVASGSLTVLSVTEHLRKTNLQSFDCPIVWLIMLDIRNAMILSLSLFCFQILFFSCKFSYPLHFSRPDVLPPREDDPQMIAKVFVGNLPKDACSREIENAFRSFGLIKDVWVARNPPGFAFVEFFHCRDADEAVRRMDGEWVRCFHLLTLNALFLTKNSTRAKLALKNWK